MKTATIERQTCANCPYFQDFGEPNGRGWCSTFDQMARLDHERTGVCDKEIEAVEEELQEPVLEPMPQPQPAGVDSNLTSCQSRPAHEALSQFEQGNQHGQHDADVGWHPIYAEALSEYATGYLSGYNAVLNSTTEETEASKQLEWLVYLDSRWGLYQAWVNNRCIGIGSTHEEAERKAQAYIATDELIKRQNAAVLAAYAC